MFVKEPRSIIEIAEMSIMISHSIIDAKPLKSIIYESFDLPICFIKQKFGFKYALIYPILELEIPFFPLSLTLFLLSE